jgi:hypothetical protein
MLKVIMATGDDLIFEGDTTFEIEDTGRLRVFVDGSDVAIFAHRGWLALGRQKPPAEPDVDMEADNEVDEF